MKKIISLCLGISFLCSLSLQAGTQIQETSAIGLGSLSCLYGLSLMHKSTKEKGTAAQAVVGAFFTAAGAFLATHGPKWIRSKNHNIIETGFSNLFKKDITYQSNKKTTQQKCNRQLGPTNNAAMKAAIHVYLTLLKYDPFEMIPVMDQ